MALQFSSPRAARASQTGVAIIADTREIARLGRDLRRAAPEAWKECQSALRASARPVLEEAKARSQRPGPKGTAPSSRVADSLRIRVGAGNVKIVGGGDAAPEAAPIENRGQGFVRHPVFGNREQWTAKNSRPAFLGPALEAHREQVALEIEEAVVRAVERAIGGR